MFNLNLSLNGIWLLDRADLDLCCLQLGVYCWIGREEANDIRSTFCSLVPEPKKAGAGRYCNSQLLEEMLFFDREVLFLLQEESKNQSFPYHIVAGHYRGLKGYNKSKVPRNAFSKRKQ